MGSGWSVGYMKLVVELRMVDYRCFRIVARDPGAARQLRVKVSHSSEAT